MLGMHRSGTSLVTSLVERVGFSYGKYPMQPSKDNPNGYWEDEFIVNINSKLLSSLSYQWFSLAWLDAKTLKQSPIYEDLRSLALDYLNELLSENKNVVIKDPRLCILLPFWLDVFSEIDAEIKVVLVKRHFVSIASSLVKRDCFDHEYATQLIYLHWAAIVHFLPASYNSFLIQYEDIKNRELEVRQKLTSFLGIKAIASSSLFERELEHHVTTFSHDSGFGWQRDMLLNFPNAPVDETKIRSLSTFYKALNVAYGRDLHRRSVINDIRNFANNYKRKRVVLYGASELSSLLVGQLCDAIVLGVDYSVANNNKLSKYGIVFHSPQKIVDVKHDVIVVGVTGRESEITDLLGCYSRENIIFAEKYLF